MKKKIGIVIAVVLIICGCFYSKSAYNSLQKSTKNHEPEIAVMYAHPELAEEFVDTLIKGVVPNPETLKITYCKAQYIALERAYIVNCYFHTEDAYGDMRSYKVQITVQILPDGNGGVRYNAIDFKEIR